MIYKKTLLLAGLLTGLAVVSSYAQTPDVPDRPAVADNSAAPKPANPGERRAKLGSPALPLTVLEWIKGKPVQIRPGTNNPSTYVLIFCPLTKASEFALENFYRLQKEYQDKGVVVITISDESPEQLKDYVRLKGAGINFTVAADDMPGRTAKNYLQAFNEHLIPRAFIVGTNGTVLWFGHPLTENMGRVVDDIASGKYNLEQAKKNVLVQEQMEQYLFLARQNDARSAKAGRMLLLIRTNDAVGLCELASKIATDPSIENDKRDVALANAALDRSEQLTTTNATDVAVTRAINTKLV